MQVSEETLRDYDLLRDDCGLLELPDISLLEITGDDRKGWLQGQATNDLRKLEPGASSEFCLTSISGHLLSVCQAWAFEGSMLITCATESVGSVLRRFEQMVIMEDVYASEASQRLRLVSIQGPAATAKLSRVLALPNLDAGVAELEGASVFCMRSNRTGLGGWDLCLPANDSNAMDCLSHSFPRLGSEAFEAARIEAGIPVYGRDMSDRTMPPEMGPSFEARHISYSKGCYMGQEVLMRLHSRGHTNRSWMGVLADKPIAIGATVIHPNRADAGKVTSAACSPDFGYIGAAMVRREVAFDREAVEIEGHDGTTSAELRTMPLLKFD
ncbi:MAG: hypothetical protein P4L46_12425 [Fimbriimonas sp.]|nr:hypothetical protein [Fimbriimonas sp.]